MNTNYPFDIEITLFDKNYGLTDEMLSIREKLTKKDIYKILEDSISIFNGKYKILLSKSNLPVISTDDNTKQLSLSIPNIDLPKYKYSLYFIQKHSNPEYFSISELKEVIDSIRIHLETYLEYEIDDPIIFLDTSCL